MALDLNQWIIVNCEGIPDAYVNAVVNKTLNVLKRAILANKFNDHRIWQLAARCGNLELLQWAKENECLDKSSLYDYYKIAAMFGHINILEWGREDLHCYQSSLYNCAALGGQIEVLRWARTNGYSDLLAYLDLVKRGDIERLKFVKDNGCSFSTLHCMRATEHNQFECLKWLRDNGCPWDAYTCGMAAQCGNLEMLKWARANGCPWDYNTGGWAITNGHMHILKWIKENGYQFTADDHKHTIANGREDVLKWLGEINCPKRQEMTPVNIRVDKLHAVVTSLIENGRETISIEELKKMITD